MKTGKTLSELAAELERQAATRRDFRADTRELTMLNGSEVSITGNGEFKLKPLAHDQLGRYLDIPSKFYDRLRGQHPGLLDHNVNTLLRSKPETRLVRTLDGQVRAFLSNRYRRLDNDELAQAILPVLGEIPDVQFPSMEITDTRMFIKAVAPQIQAEVKKGDIVQAGVIISNSEVGLGSLSVEGMVFRLACLNGVVYGDTVRRYHVGRQIEGDGEAAEIFKDETLRADDRAFWLKVRDTVQAAVTESRFAQVVDKLRDATHTVEIVDPSKGVQEIGRRFGLTEGEQASVLRFLTRGGDLTQYGAIQAVTRAAHDVESYDRSVELETIGGALLEVPDWARIALPAAA